ncbi:unnamed protein product [Paramecium primaurelia]|uniref:PSI domain-containing protein n=1 Tax=Paramecium primaurelia TaxID=5886 RepID=A0A8S1NQ41_PARPR|nr:unnamed protein product [Paramecium primaurelia]
MIKNIISLIIIAFGAICGTQLTIQITNQCECSQFSQNFCGTLQSDQTCYWNSTSQACLRKGCQQLQSQETCLQNFSECYWNGSYCQQFTSCSQLTYQNISCTQQNIQCGQFTYNSTSCLSLDELPICQFFNQDQCTPEQIGYQGTLCFFSNDTQQCQTATSCSQLQSQSQCTQWKNTCQWNSINNQCVQLQCDNFTSQSTCTNIILDLNPQTIMPCQYVNGICQSIESAKQLTSQDCSNKTLSTYYWIQANNTTGTCIPCSITNKYQPNNKCSCSSYLIQQCQSSSYCQWSNGECNPIECNQILDQLSCLQNLGCSWYNTYCSTFYRCPVAFSHQQCIESSFNCLILNNNNCQVLSDNSCSNIYNLQQCQSQLGYCYWNGNQCQQVEKCQQITQQRQCYRFGYTCIWQNGRCQQLTCNKISLKNNCIYTIPKLYTNDVQPCVWQNGQCQDLNSVNSLDAAQCQLISLDTYKWTGSKCIKCIEFQQQIQNFLELPNQCKCYQLFIQQQCQQMSYCYWQSGYWSGGYCLPYQCQNITNQTSCVSNPNCFWIDHQCLTFQSCNLLKGASQSECIVQSINCPASDGTNCQDKQYLQACQSYLNQNQCQYVLGSDGICFWQSNFCQVLSKCTQIKNQEDCLQFKKQCYWGTSCQPASCSQFQTYETCQFYYSSINSYTPVPCQWNSTTNVCTQPTNYMTQLNSNNCQTNTNKGARWSQTLNACLSCQTPQPPNPKQCSCSQLISQINCMQSLQCLWNTQTNSCQQLPCQNLQQSLCIQNSQCMWIGSCQQFTQCSNLKANTSQECAAQSLYCPYYNPNTQKCQVASKEEIQDCWGLSQENCNFLITPSYSCIWNTQENICLLQTNNYCDLYYSQYQCQSSPYCYYQNGCKPKQCQHFYTKESCTFSINPQNWNYIQSCSWLNGACVPADNLFSEQTCFTNTDQTARWSSNIKDGFCIPCNLPLHQVIVPKNKCLCSQFLSFQECELAQCNWEGNFCVDKYCGDFNQIYCIQHPSCYWIYSNNNSQGGYCENIDYKELIYSKDPCTKLRGNNSLQCLSQSLLCPVSLNGF